MNENICKSFVNFKKTLATKSDEFKKSSTATVMTKTGGKYSYSYIDLDTILNVVTPVLAENDLFLVQNYEKKENGEILKTIIFHSTGESLEFETPFERLTEARMTEIQALGSSITYMRRYAISSILGIASEEDTDANSKENTKFEKKEVQTNNKIAEFELPFKAGTNYDNLAPFICKVVKLFKINELFASEKQANFMWGLCRAKDYGKLFPSLEKTINFLQSKQNLSIANIVKNELIELLNKSEKNNKISADDKNNALEFLKDEFADIRSVLLALPDILLEKILEMKTAENKQAKLVEQTNLSAFDDEIPFG